MLRTDAPAVTDLLAPDRIRVGLPVEGKEEAIKTVVSLLDGARAVRDLDRVRKDVWAREGVMSTGVGKGLALPHARTSAVVDTVAALVVTTGPVEYHSLDGQPVRLIFLLVGPEDERSQHVRLLSRISRLMNRDAFRARLLQAPDAAAVLAAFREGEEGIG